LLDVIEGYLDAARLAWQRAGADCCVMRHRVLTIEEIGETAYLWRIRNKRE